MEIWKAFEKNKISHSAAHHLMTIYDLLGENGYARVTDVARRLEITRGSASITLKTLKEKGLVKEDQNKFLLLSDEATSISQSIQSMRTIFKKFLITVLNVNPCQAEIDACKIEHLLSPETGKKLLIFMKFMSGDDKNARNFLETFHLYEQSSKCNITNCAVCDDECLMSQQTYKEDS